jgi:hypothetical protein
LAAGALGSSVVTASLLPATRRKGEYMNRGVFINPDDDPRWTAHIIRTQRSFSEVDRLSIALLEIRLQVSRACRGTPPTFSTS